MKIILLQDVKSLGKAGDEVEVKDGYARNLISKKQGVESTPKTRNDLKLQKQHEEKVQKERFEEAVALAERLKGTSVDIPVKVGKDGKLFGSVSSKEIAEACKDQLGLDVDKKKLVLPEPIKEVGKSVIPLKLHSQVTAELTVVVKAE
ncbi:MAG: 50S ribosomal protein L9 [Lachnospiraceae bacterium]|nr:50S ribosomal protein L9 [Lachnospiraceae bacterium]